jgi:hypothetical protein
MPTACASANAARRAGRTCRMFSIFDYAMDLFRRADYVIGLRAEDHSGLVSKWICLKKPP